MRQALELALEALERSVATCFDQRSHDEVMGRPEHFVNQAITAIKEALAQSEQEPVAWLNPIWPKYCGPQSPVTTYMTNGWVPLYTTPPQRKPLTDDEIAELWLDIYGSTPPSGIHEDGLLPWRLARAIEAAHGIKE